MKMNKILKDILKLHPELEKDKASLKKTVKFLSAVEPKVVIDANFKAKLGERLDSLAAIKSSSVEEFTKRLGFFHIFSGVFASLLAFFGLFYVFGDSLFYTGEAPAITEYQQGIPDIDILQETKLEIKSPSGISEPSEPISVERIVQPQQTEVPDVIIIREDGASQIDVSQSQKLKIEPQTPQEIKTQRIVESSPDSETKQDAQFESLPATDDQQDTTYQSLPADDTISESSIDASIRSTTTESLQDEGIDTDHGDESNNDFGTNFDMMRSPAAGSMMAPEMAPDMSNVQQDTPHAIEEINDIEEESYDDVLDEFTLRCDVFGGEISIKNDIRVCMIGDIVCSEGDFLEGVCELGQE